MFVFLLCCNIPAERSRAQNYNENIKKYTKRINKNKSDIYAYYIRGGIYYLNKEYDKAIYDFQKAIEINSDFDGAHAGLSYVFFEQKRFRKALASINKAIKIEGSSIQYNFQRAKCYDELNNKFKAINDYSVVIKEKPVPPPDEKSEKVKSFGLYREYLTSLLRRAVLQYQIGKYHDSIKDVNEFLKYYKDNAESYTIRGSSLIQLKKYDDALSDFKVSINKKPDFALPYTNIAYIYSIKKNKEMAEIYLINAMKKGMKNRNLINTMKELVDIIGKEKVENMFIRYAK